jgi:hypothetical protein
MFTVRATETWDAPESVQESFLLEEKLDLPTDELILQGRSRSTGQRSWIKCRSAAEGARELLEAEARIVSGLDHPHILPVKTGGVQDGSYLLFQWEAEQPLNEDLLAALQPVGRARVAQALVSVVNYLQGLPEPVAHGQLVMEHLWVSARIGWLRLAGFGRATPGAGGEALRSDRQAAVTLVDHILAANEIPPAVQKELRLFGAAWMEDPGEGTADFTGVLKRVLLGCVTVDL